MVTVTIKTYRHFRMAALNLFRFQTDQCKLINDEWSLSNISMIEITTVEHLEGRSFK